MHVTRLRITDQLRKRRPGVSKKPPRSSETSRTATIERVADPVCVLESIWDEEWQKNIVDAAMERVKRRVKPDHYQIFYLNVVKKLGVRKVADMVGVNVAQVYLVKHRIGTLIKKEVQKLEANEL